MVAEGDGSCSPRAWFWSTLSRMRRGLQLASVVLLGRTLDEYRRYFALDRGDLEGRSILDVASGVSSFCAEANRAGWNVTAVDPIYDLAPDVIRERCARDLEHVTGAIDGLTTYRWDFYQSPERLKEFRRRAYTTFLEDYPVAPRGRYVAASLPSLPFRDGMFDLVLVSYLLLVYEEHFTYEFHRDALRELMRLTRHELRLYPLVNFEARDSSHLPRLVSDPALAAFAFEEVQTDFEFLLNSNRYLRVTWRDRDPHGSK